MNKQLDWTRDSPAKMAEAMREQARAALVDPHWTPAQQQWRHSYYTEQAERLEQQQDMDHA